MKQSEKKLLKNVELASKIVLKEDEELLKELGKEKPEKIVCFRCKKNKATLQYTDNYLSYAHGFIEHICQECYDKIKKSNSWYQEGFKDGQKNTDSLSHKAIWHEGYRNAVEEVLLELDGETIYPYDIFPELDDYQLKEVHEILQTKLGFPLDRLSAHVSRLILSNISKKIRCLKSGGGEHDKL